MDPLMQIPILNQNVVGRIVEGEAVLVSPERGTVTVLNEVGAAIWKQVDGLRSVREIAGGVAEEYEVDLARAEADTLALLGQLAEKDILSFASRPAPAAG